MDLNLNGEKLNIKSILFLDAMLTPKLITFVYWLLLALAVISGLGMVFSGLGLIISGNFASGIGTLIIGPIFLLIGVAYARIICEFVIVIFKIHENTRTLANKD